MRACVFPFYFYKINFSLFYGSGHIWVLSPQFQSKNLLFVCSMNSCSWFIHILFNSFEMKMFWHNDVSINKPCHHYCTITNISKNAVQTIFQSKTNKKRIWNINFSCVWCLWNLFLHIKNIDHQHFHFHSHFHYNILFNSIPYMLYNICLSLIHKICPQSIYRIYNTRILKYWISNCS